MLKATLPFFCCFFFSHPLLAQPPINAGEFVTRAGSALMLAGREFRFAGNNAYFLQPEIAYRNEAGVRETLNKAVALGLTVVRSHGFNDHPVPGNDPAVIQSAPGVFNEANLVALDQVIAEAKSRDLRLILNFTNNWTAYGGIRRYVFWKLNRTPNDQEAALFFTDETIKGWFKDYLRMLLNRTNTATGVKYKDEPAILAWELANELRNRGDATALLAWETEMAAFIKSVDGNHLVADGGEGFDDNPAAYAGISNAYAVNGFEGCSFSRLVNIPDLDLVSYHFYPSSWGLNDTTDADVWMRVHQQLARAAGKVAYLGEFGTRVNNSDPPNCDRTPGRQYDTVRAQIYERWLKAAVLDYGTSGQMAWQLVYDQRTDCDGFAVYCDEDTGSCAVLRKYATVQAQPALATVSAASYFASPLANEAIAAVFGVSLASETQVSSTVPLPTSLANARVTLLDATGIERAASLFFVSPSQLNILLPVGLTGNSIIKLIRNEQVTAYGSLTMARLAPGLFTANANGQGIAAAVALHIKADGSLSYEPIARFDSALNAYVAIPIDLGSESEQVFLLLFGTGLRNRLNLASVTANLGGVAAPVTYAGAQGDYVGLDQINLRLPRSLIGRDEMQVLLAAEGKVSNAVKINVK